MEDQRIGRRSRDRVEEGRENYYSAALKLFGNNGALTVGGRTLRRRETGETGSLIPIQTTDGDGATPFVGLKKGARPPDEIDRTILKPS